MVTTVTISETIFGADADIPPHAHIRFYLSSWDSSETDSGTPIIAPKPVLADIDPDTGAISVALWRNRLGLRGTVYEVTLEQFTDANKTTRAEAPIALGNIQIPADAETSDLSSLLATPVTVSEVWYQTITEAEYNAAVGAAVVAEAWAQGATAPDPDDATSKSAKTWAGVAEDFATLAINQETASYTLTLADANNMVEMNVATANTLTVPANAAVAFPVGTQIIVTQTGAGKTTIAGAAGVTVNTVGSLRLVAQWGVVALIKLATNTWVAFGGLEE